METYTTIHVIDILYIYTVYLHWTTFISIQTSYLNTTITTMQRDRLFYCDGLDPIAVQINFIQI
jgi:hypothetical protein